MRQNSVERRIRKLRAQYRRRTVVWAIVMLLIGIALGVVADKLLLSPKDKASEPPVTADATPIVEAELTPKPATPTPEPTAEPTPIPEAEPAAEPEGDAPEAAPA
ncbi:MAG: hypothetical protein IJ646_07120, partial [Clostridia bacterium]|nr:hypothetical protein [Clostridia bacterium]